MLKGLEECCEVVFFICTMRCESKIIIRFAHMLYERCGFEDFTAELWMVSCSNSVCFDKL